MAASAGGTPLRLKDLLELDCDSCSAAGFRCYPRRLLCESSASASAPIAMRHLLDSSSPSMRRRRPSKLSHLSRSLSRRLSRRGGFWWRRDDDEEEEDAAAAPKTAMATAASPGCGCTSSEELELETSSESSDNYSSGMTSTRGSRSESDSVLSSSATDDCSVHHHPSQAAATGDEEHEVVMKRRVSKEGSSSGSEADDKEQLSPVGVMDFPFDDDDEELRDAGVACSPSFSLARLQRRKTHKIRRFGSRDDDELAPLDLEALLTATSESDANDVPAQQMMIECSTGDAATPARETSSSSSHRGAADVFHEVPVPDEDDDLVSLLMSTVSADSSERLLLLDLFVEVKRRQRCSEPHARTDDGAAAAAAVAAAARGWLESGTGTERRWGLTDVLSAGAAIVAEMERSRRWMEVGEEEREVGAVVAGMLADQLVDEVVREFLFV